jgi:hypothetical protein
MQLKNRILIMAGDYEDAFLLRTVKREKLK